MQSAKLDAHSGWLSKDWRSVHTTDRVHGPCALQVSLSYARIQFLMRVAKHSFAERIVVTARVVRRFVRWYVRRWL